MRLIVFFILVFTCYNKGLCQKDDAPNIYLISLTSHLEYLKSVNKKSIELVYVEKNEVTTVDLPDQIEGTKVIYLTRSEIRAKTQKGRRIMLIVVRPVVVKSKLIKVAVVDFSVTSKKNNFNYANGGGSTFEFTYNCDLQKFELTNKEQGGI